MADLRLWARCVSIVVLLAIFPSCASYQTRSASGLADGRARPIRVTLADQSHVMFRAAMVVNDTIVSTRPLSETPASEPRDRLPIEDARLIEVRRIDPGRTALLLLGISAGVAALMGIAVAQAMDGAWSNGAAW